MKSCPACNRTFDDTLTFCLVDGSILSAPFDPRAGASPKAVRDPGPPPTQMLNVEPSPPQTAAPPPTIGSVTPADLPAAPSETVAGPFVYSEPASGALPTAARDVPVSMKTMLASPPEVPFAGVPKRPAAETTPDTHVPRSRAPQYALMGIGLLVLVAIVVGGVVWLIKHNHNSTIAASNSEPVQPGPVAANNKPAAADGPFTEKINGAEIEMVSIPGGTFLMGSPLSESGRDPDEGPQSNVTVQNFHLSKYEVTQAQYRAVMGTNPASFKGDDLPVESVTWNDALEFCRKLSSLTGRKYRLPTEAEWEYAARGGSDSQTAGDVDALAWCGPNSANRTHPVGQKQANAFGLYDMYGNVWEWCESKYRPYPYQATDGREDLQPTDVRVLRGGSWESATRACRASYRRRVVPDPRSSGFRLALDSD